MMESNTLVEPTFPALTGRVVDGAGLLSAAEINELDAKLKAIEDSSSDQVVVVTVSSLQGYSIEDYGLKLGNHWGVGSKELNNGVLLIVAPNERKVRIEVGRGLEATLTDATSTPQSCPASALAISPLVSSPVQRGSHTLWAQVPPARLLRSPRAFRCPSPPRRARPRNRRGMRS
jgi:hypothetical protein